MSAGLSLDERSAKVMRRDDRKGSADIACWKSSSNSHLNALCVATVRNDGGDNGEDQRIELQRQVLKRNQSMFSLFLVKNRCLW